VRAAEVAEQVPIGLDPFTLRAVAEQVREAFDRQMASDGRWAYAVDGGGLRIDYHDANDLPTALAPLLGFCSADDPAWRATMAFAFSEANPGFVTGEPGGLGSAHTPGPWPLGEIQAWIHARITGDEASAESSLARLVAWAFADGMLPEAVALSGPIRHWFAWPGTALAALVLLDARGELSDRLRAR
jgi:meiotically up-regulated gene 157 (Mug157) protein